jgi:pilus assembly protein FimV
MQTGQTVLNSTPDNGRIGTLRAFAKLLVVPVLLLPLSAAPLGLSDIKLNSALNRPLDAEIDLMSLGDTRPEDVTVRLASREAFEGAGIDRPLYLNSLTFQVESRPDGTPYIKLGSSQAITEPFIDLLLEVDWPNGKLVREYTVLLDPPLLLDEPPAAVAAPAAGASAKAAPQPAPPSAGATAPAAAPSAVTAPAPAHQLSGAAGKTDNGGWTYGPVERDGTLYSIAQDLREYDPSLSVEQIMMALLRSNPQAFYNGNINELKAGYVLRIDDPAAVRELSQAAAVAEVRRQTAQWMDAKNAAAQAADVRPQGAETTARADGGAAAAADSGPRLRLRAPDAAEADKLAAGGETEKGEGESAGGSPSVSTELAAALEASAAARQENAELRERLAKLEQQIASMQRLLSLKDETLTVLQQSGRSGTAEGGSLRGLLNDPMILAAGGLAVLVLSILGWLIVRRARMARASLEEFTRAEVRQMPPASAGVAAAAAGLVSEVPVARTEEAAHGAEEGGDLLQADEDEIDILAEADVYLAYRRFDKAEELLREAIKEEPARRDLALKLLEVYAASGNTDAFLRQAEGLKASLEPAESMVWDKVVTMGRRLVPGHALFEPAHLIEEAAAPAGGGGEPEAAPQFHELLDSDFEKELQADASSPAEDESNLAELDLTLDEATLDRLKEPEALDSSLFETEQEETRLVANGEPEMSFASERRGKGSDGGLGGDIEWLSAAGEDLLKFEDDESQDSEADALISGEDEVDTKLDLAKAYIDMGDQESARNILTEVANEGDQDQQREAHDLMRQIG